MDNNNIIRISRFLDFLHENGVVFKFYGDETALVRSFCPLNNLKSDSITWIRSIKNYDISTFDNYKNMLVIAGESRISFDCKANFIIVDDPHSVYFSILRKFFSQKNVIEGYVIKPGSIVETSKIGKNVKIGSGCYICGDVEIHDDVTIYNNVSIECKTVIGSGTVVYSGAVIGMDGYAYYDDVEFGRVRVPHLGGVIIGKNVEIGSCVCIAKGCLGNTVIEDGTKVDNLCHIAHNTYIRENSRIVALAMLGGSCTIGRDCWVAPSSAIIDQGKVGDHCIVGMGAVVTKPVSDNMVVAGVPAKVIRANNKKLI